MITLDLTESAVMGVLRSLLMGIVPGVEVIQAQDNRVSEPSGVDYVLLTPLLRRRLETNIDTPEDAIVTGSLDGSTLNVSHVTRGQVRVGSPVYGTDVADGVTVIGLGTGTGNVGSYTILPAQLLAERTLYVGTRGALQPLEFTVQITVHGPHSDDNATMISTLLRDEYATDVFDASAVGGRAQLLHCDDPKQVPFVNAEDQWETRWIVDACLQINPTTRTPQRFSDTLVTTIHEADDPP